MHAFQMDYKQILTVYKTFARDMIMVHKTNSDGLEDIRERVLMVCETNVMVYKTFAREFLMVHAKTLMV